MCECALVWFMRPVCWWSTPEWKVARAPSGSSSIWHLIEWPRRRRRRRVGFASVNLYNSLPSLLRAHQGSFLCSWGEMPSKLKNYIMSQWERTRSCWHLEQRIQHRCKCIRKKSTHAGRQLMVSNAKTSKHFFLLKYVCLSALDEWRGDGGELIRGKSVKSWRINRFFLNAFRGDYHKKLLGGNFILIMTLYNLAELHRDFKT